jgi:hypothetical protein
MPRQVILTFKAFEEIINYCSQYSSFRIDKEKWIESMGFLFCRTEGDFYIIEDAVGMASGTELDVCINPMDLGKIDEIERDREGFIGGWWHTHPNLTPFFSETDIKNQMWYQQANEDGLGLVFDHAVVSQDYMGFDIFRLVHKFSEEYIKLPYQLKDFTPERIKRIYSILGIDENILNKLAETFGSTSVSLKIDFSKLPEPLVDNPLDDSDWISSEGDELLKAGNIIDAIKKYKTAAIILQNTEHFSKFAQFLIKLIFLCAENQYFENAEEELKIFNQIKEKINIAEFEQDLGKINTLLKNH